MKKTFWQVLIFLLICIVMLVACSNNTQKHEDDNSSISPYPHEKQLKYETRTELLNAMGGVLETDVYSMWTYINWLQDNYFICGYASDVSYNTKDKKYEFFISDSGYSFEGTYINGSSVSVDEGDFVYVCGRIENFETDSFYSPKGIIDSSFGSVSLLSDSNDYMSVEDFQSVCKKIKKTYFKVFGVAFDYKEAIHGSQPNCLLYESEKSYATNTTISIKVNFSVEQSNIVGKSICVIGKCSPLGYGSLYDCSISDP